MEKREQTQKLNNANPALLKALVFALLFVTVSIPLFRNYIPDTGDQIYWMMKLQRFDAFLTKPILWRAAMALLNALGILSAYGMFAAAFKEKEFEVSKTGIKDYELKSILATCMFVLSPYRFYVTYEMCDYSEILIWVLIPAVVMFAISFIRNKSVPSALAAVILLIVTGGAFAVKYVYPTSTFAEGGYSLGDLFLTFHHTENHPGLGMPVFLGAFVWLYALTEEKDSRRYSVYSIIGTVSVILSLRFFPWDVPASKLPVAEKIIRHFGSPSFFVGLSVMFLCFPAAKGIFFLKENKNKIVAEILPGILILFIIAVWLFLCSKAMYFQYPLE
ncbi:MAG: hypothetical protein K5776_07055 [Lachnospiraceae bacterium]|nr:hypothetical protein [Lachnospiraceae bacterium]